MIRVGLGEGGLDDQLTVLARVLELVREVDGEVGPATSAAAGSRTT